MYQKYKDSSPPKKNWGPASLNLWAGKERVFRKVMTSEGLGEMFGIGFADTSVEKKFTHERTHQNGSGNAKEELE